MKITPIEIRQKSFEKAFRGYIKEEVDAFLHSLSQEWEKMLEENKQLKSKLEVSEKEVQRLRDVEHSLFKTIRTAENTGASVVEQAHKAAELHLKEAQIRAEAILNETRSRAKNMIEEAEESTRDIMLDIQEDVKYIVKEYQYIEDQKDAMLQSMQNLMLETQERVERAKNRSGRNDMDKRLREIKALIYEKRNQDALGRIEEKESYSQQVREVQKPIENAKPVHIEVHSEDQNLADKEQKSFFDSL